MRSDQQKVHFRRPRFIQLLCALSCACLFLFQTEKVAVSSVDYAAAETVQIASRYGLEIPIQVGDVQKPRLDSEFSRLFRKIKDLSPPNVRKYVEARPTEYHALIRYIERLERENYILPQKASSLKRASTQGLAARFAKRAQPGLPVLLFDGSENTSVISTTYVNDFANKELQVEKPSEPSTPELDRALKLFKAAMNGQDVEKLASDEVEDAAKEAIAEQTEGALSKTFKNAKVDIIGIDNSHPEFEVGFVASIKETEDTTTFQQTTVNAYDGRTTLNLGLGHRLMSKDRRWLTGFNAFYDHEFPNNHQRASMGLELISSPLSMTGNYYQGVSGYRSDKDGREQKPIDGFDAKLSAALPYLPGVKASYETSKWFGEDGIADLTRETYGLTGQLSKNFSIAVEKAEFSDNRDDQESLRLSYQWSPSDYEPPTIFDVSAEPWVFDSVESERYRFADRENKILKQRELRKFTVRIGAS